jgi:hypothetical protein
VNEEAFLESEERDSKLGTGERRSKLGTRHEEVSEESDERRKSVWLRVVPY